MSQFAEDMQGHEPEKLGKDRLIIHRERVSDIQHLPLLVGGETPCDLRIAGESVGVVFHTLQGGSCGCLRNPG